MTASAAEIKPRSVALDALRGFAILLMCLSGRVPFGQHALPAWMYHAQNPPPSGGLNTTIPGFTWVDWVFPMFLFSMGVAIPLALGGRLQRGQALWKTTSDAAVRAVLLLGFAIYFQHVTPGVFNAAATSGVIAGWLGMSAEALGTIPPLLIGFVAFVLLFPVYMRLPEGWPVSRVMAIRIVGVVLCAALLAVLRYPGNPAGLFSLARSNIILVVLANMAFFGTVIYALTVGRPLVRLSILPFLYALLYSSRVPESWAAELLVKPFAEIGWAFRFDYLKYLFLIIPATIVGEELRRWMNDREVAPPPVAWPPAFVGAQAALLFAVIVLTHVALQGRHMVLLVATVTAAAIALHWLPKAVTATERWLAFLLRWGTLALLLGLFFEPMEGGISKSPADMSYYFVSLGLSMLFLHVLTVVIDINGLRRPFGMVVYTGQNPMIAYLGINNLMEPVVALVIKVTGYTSAQVVTSPGTGFLWGFTKTALLGGLTSVFTRLRIFWKS